MTPPSYPGGDGGRADAPLIEVAGLEKRYAPVRRGAPPTHALAGIELAIADGEFVSVVGPSGCGKSTLLHIMAGLDRPSAGSVRLAGRDVAGPGPERAVVFQTPALYPWLNVRDNVAFGLHLRDGRRLGRQRVDYFIERVGLTGFDRHRPYHLSGGMQQRAAIARALITEPRVLLMDEPFGALDAQTRNDMQAFLLDLWQSLRSTVVFVTHDVEEAVLLGDRVVVITHRPGKVAEVVPVPLARPRTWESTLGVEFTALRRSVLTSLRAQGRPPQG